MKNPYQPEAGKLVTLLLSNNFKIGIVILSLSLLCACSKFTDIPGPTTSINGSNVYNDDATATSVLTGIYAQMSSTGNNLLGGVTTLSILTGLSADEINTYSGNTNFAIGSYYTNSLSADRAGYEYWNVIYPYIFVCNSAIHDISQSTTLSSKVKFQLLGEAKFMRAFFYYYLVNMYGDVPLMLNTDYAINAKAARASKTMVYQQIVKDLTEAGIELSTNYLNGNLQPYVASPERVRPNKWTSAALLARVHLFMGNYADAYKESNSVISNATLFSLVPLSNAFLRNNTEAIWQLQPVNNGWNTEDAKFFDLSTAPTGLSSSKPFYLSSKLLNNFEPGDARKDNWIKSYTDASGTFYFPYKYKISIVNSAVNEYLTVLRLSEQYLIRAEAQAQGSGKGIPGAIEDLNKIRNRSALSNTTASEKQSLLAAILHEREVELFCEWGHRWFDLKRTNTIDAVMSVASPQKINGVSWKSYQSLYPVPAFEIQRNPNLTQNAGY